MVVGDAAMGSRSQRDDKGNPGTKRTPDKIEYPMQRAPAAPAAIDRVVRVHVRWVGCAASTAAGSGSLFRGLPVVVQLQIGVREPSMHPTGCR